MLEFVDRCKAALDAARPLEMSILLNLRDYYKIGLTWSSNALEGNTLTITETKVILEDGLTVGGHPLWELYEATGHGAAYDHMCSLVRRRRISVADIREMHRLFYRQINERYAGVWRDQQVFITGSDVVLPTPDEIPEKMERLDSWMAEQRTRFHPVEFAALLHLKLVLIHPFIDGNGRISRMAMNLALLQDGYTPAVIPPICRTDYLSAIDRCQRHGDSSLFVNFIAERVAETEKEILRLLNIPIPKSC